MDGSTIKSAGLAMGSVAHKPWRVPEAEQAPSGKTASPEIFAHAADILLRGAHGYDHNRFKIELAKQGVVRALTVAAQGTSEVA
jgi:xanthine dehydrogenase YagS FAD-binding subunit